MSPLQQRLDEFKRTFESGAPPYNAPRCDRDHASRDGGAEASGAEDAALNVGDRASAFTLPNEDDMQVSSSDLLRDGPLVVTFFRGHW
jgi:hypothetical protein